jgi:cytochrome c oxidase assembly factor 6
LGWIAPTDWVSCFRRESHADSKQVEYFKKRRVVEYQKVQTIRRIEAEGGEVYPPGPLPPQ